MHEKAENRTRLTYFVLVNLHSVELQNPKASLELKIVNTREEINSSSRGVYVVCLLALRTRLLWILKTATDITLLVQR